MLAGGSVAKDRSSLAYGTVQPCCITSRQQSERVTFHVRVGNLRPAAAQVPDRLH